MHLEYTKHLFVTMIGLTTNVFAVLLHLKRVVRRIRAVFYANSIVIVHNSSKKFFLPLRLRHLLKCIAKVGVLNCTLSRQNIKTNYFYELFKREIRFTKEVYTKEQS